MKIIVLGGAANMAQPAINYLVKLENVEQIVLTDINEVRIGQIAKQLGSKTVAKKIDLNHDSDLEAILRGADLVMNFIGPYYRFGTKALHQVLQIFYPVLARTHWIK